MCVQARFLGHSVKPAVDSNDHFDAQGGPVDSSGRVLTAEKKRGTLGARRTPDRIGSLLTSATRVPRGGVVPLRAGCARGLGLSVQKWVATSSTFRTDLSAPRITSRARLPAPESVDAILVAIFKFFNFNGKNMPPGRIFYHQSGSFDVDRFRRYLGGGGKDQGSRHRAPRPNSSEAAPSTSRWVCHEFQRARA